MPSGRPPHPHAPRKPGADRRREIADAALRVLAEHGPGRFTALAVAEAVGLTDAALFRHFTGMDAIVLAAIERLEQALLEGFPPGEPEPLARLGAFFRRRVAVIRARPGIARLIASDELARVAPPEGVRRLAELRARSQGFVHACMVEAAQEGALAPGIQPEEGALMVMGTLLALSHPAAAPDGGETDLPERAWRVLEALLRGQEPAERDPPSAATAQGALSREVT